MSGWLHAIDERDLRHSVQRLERIVRTGDTVSWKSVWLSTGTNNAAEMAERRDLPELGSNELMDSFRILARLKALRSADLWERSWHVHYPNLSDEEAGFEVSESEEYEAIGLHVFTVGAPPPGLEFLDEQPNVATNWVSLVSVQRLWRLEEAEGMLATVGANLSACHTPLGHDLLTLRSMLEYCIRAEAALYLWDPGS